MARRAFFSFHYKPDSWRASQIRNMGVMEGNPPATDNDWETITRGGDSAVQRWIDSQLDGRSCTVVLIGANTANRKWINYEIIKSWNDGKGLLGIYVHHLLDADRRQATKGVNPFSYITIKSGTVSLSTIVEAQDSPFQESTLVYSHIKINLPQWIDRAIEIRAKY